LTTTTFVGLDGGDGYTMLKGATIIIPPERAPTDSDALQRAISLVRAIAPKLEGRIKRLDTVRKGEPDCK
jgi:hypothetical protein